MNLADRYCEIENSRTTEQLKRDLGLIQDEQPDGYGMVGMYVAEAERIAAFLEETPDGHLSFDKAAIRRLGARFTLLARRIGR